MKSPKPYFSVLVSFWNREQEHWLIPVAAANSNNEATLLFEILKKLSHRRGDLAKISIAQHGGKAVPWIRKYVRAKTVPQFFFGDQGLRAPRR